MNRKTLPWEEISGAAVIRTSGAFTASILPQLEYTVQSLAGRAPSHIILDCALISDIDAAVIAFLLRSGNRLRKYNITFALCNLNREMKRKFEILNVYKCLTILDKALNDPDRTLKASRPDQEAIRAENTRLF
ncbi:MAG TPA: STAS domain-containing protein [Spirochaetota bacterium]|nr:STAS domain-containing protein [Spirochaetota bacterium]HPV43447.1 STAS domain-containing protein [Spirochaetota bacterium]